MMLKDSFSRFVKGSYAMYTSHESKQARRDRFPKATRDPLPNAQYLLAHGASSPLAGISLGGLGLSNALGEDRGVLVLNHCQRFYLAHK